MIDKTKEINELNELVDQFSSACKNKDYVNAQNEEWVKWNFIEPLLERILGWKKSDIEKEKRVLKGRADYILRVGNEEVAVIEAKKVGTNISEEAVKQGISYAYHRKIKFAIITNFKEIRVYHALSNTRDVDHNLLKFKNGEMFRFKFEQFRENIDKLMLLSRENFESKELNKLLSKKDERTSRLIDESILDDLLEIREWLSKDLKKLRPHLSKDQIDEIVQIFIDRLIFMRSVEDRGLEERDFLLKMVKDFQEGRTDKRLWESLKIKFKIFDKEYNSKLFSEGILEKEGFFDELTLIKIIKELYFGNEGKQERYMFDEIPGDLLGTIYEQYLGTILQGTDKRVKLKEKSGKRKRMGIYYTPSYIVEYIIKNTVGAHIKDKSIDEILEVRVLDPACGSGSFLSKAYEEISRVIEEKLKANQFSNKYHSFKSYNGRLKLGQKTTILENCIYWIDLDEKAVELAQLNLLLKLLEEETSETKKRILPNMGKNIQEGNSLIDDYDISEKAFKWNSRDKFKEVINEGGFDIVLGNPPYGAELKEGDRKWLENKYKLKNTDTAVLFMGLATNLTKKRGKNGFIVPKPFVYSSTWRRIRELLLEGINEIVDCGKVWKEVKLEQVVYFYDVGKEYRNYTSSIRRENLIESVGQINKTTFSEFGFLLNGVSEEEIKIGQKIRNIGGFLSDNSKNQRGGMFQNKVIPRKSDFKVLGGKQIGKYFLKSGLKGYVDRKYLDDQKIFVKENSVLVQNIVAHIENPIDHIRIIATIVENNKDKYAILDTINQIIIKSEISNKTILALLNSSLISWFAYRFIFGKAIRTMHFDSTVTNKLPFKIPNAKQEQKIINLVDKMILLQKQLQEDESGGRAKDRLDDQIKDTNYGINKEIYDLYGITKEEQKIIENS